MLIWVTDRSCAESISDERKLAAIDGSLAGEQFAVAKKKTSVESD